MPKVSRLHTSGWGAFAFLLTLLVAGRDARAQQRDAVSATGAETCSTAVFDDSANVFRTEPSRSDSTAPSTSPASRSATGSSRPAIHLIASASAREIRFAAQPTVRVRLCHGAIDTVRVLERRNLPRPVQVGRTYRDVYVAVEIVGRLSAQCIARALGAAVSGLPGVQSDTVGTCASLGVSDSATARPPERKNDNRR